MCDLPSYQYSVIIGLLLSDGWLNFTDKIKSKNAQLGFKQSLKNFEYIWYVFNILSQYCSSLPYGNIGKRNNTITYGVGFITRALPCFTNLHKLFYINKKKIIPTDIYNLLDPIALAHWIQGDGTVKIWRYSIMYRFLYDSRCSAFNECINDTL